MSSIFFLLSSHRQDQDYWKKLDTEGWKDEMVGMRKMIGQFAAIPPCEVSGEWYIIIHSSNYTRSKETEPHSCKEAVIVCFKCWLKTILNMTVPGQPGHTDTWMPSLDFSRTPWTMLRYRIVLMSPVHDARTQACGSSQ